MYKNEISIFKIKANIDRLIIQLVLNNILISNFLKINIFLNVKIVVVNYINVITYTLDLLEVMFMYLIDSLLIFFLQDEISDWLVFIHKQQNL